MSTSKTKNRRRWIVIGPGLILAAIIALQITIRERERTSVPPIIERHTVGAAAAETTRGAEISLIVQDKSRLRLTSNQLTRLERLQAEWQRKSKPLSDEMNQAAEDFQEFMSKSGDRAAIGEIQAHAAPASELSRQYSSLRRVYWQKALQALTPEQRRMIEAEALKPLPGRRDEGEEKR